jgi:hypothetical protein
LWHPQKDADLYFAFNLIYHFIRIEDSFLKGDLINLPIKNFAFLIEKNYHELELIKKYD